MSTCTLQELPQPQTQPREQSLPTLTRQYTMIVAPRINHSTGGFQYQYRQILWWFGFCAPSFFHGVTHIVSSLPVPALEEVKDKLHIPDKAVCVPLPEYHEPKQIREICNPYEGVLIFPRIDEVSKIIESLGATYHGIVSDRLLLTVTEGETMFKFAPPIEDEFGV